MNLEEKTARLGRAISDLENNRPKETTQQGGGNTVVWGVLLLGVPIVVFSLLFVWTPDRLTREEKGERVRDIRGLLQVTAFISFLFWWAAYVGTCYLSYKRKSGGGPTLIPQKLP